MALQLGFVVSASSVTRWLEKNVFEIKPAGVLIQSPPADTDKLANPETPLPGEMDVRSKWSNTTFIELVVGRMKRGRT